MRMTIVCKNIRLSPDIKALLEKKLGKLDRYFGDDTTAQVKLASTSYNTVVIEVTIPFNGTLVRAEEEDSDLRTGIETVEAKIDRQIRKHRTALKRKLRDNAFAAVPEEEDEAYGAVVRTKQFSSKPMAVEEAMTQMDLLGHGFFAFTNAATGQVNVLYRRHDGNFGLLEPEG